MLYSLIDAYDLYDYFYAPVHSSVKNYNKSISVERMKLYAHLLFCMIHADMLFVTKKYVKNLFLSNIAGAMSLFKISRQICNHIV